MGRRHTPVMSSGSPDPPAQSLTTPNPSPDLSDLRICIPEPPAVSLNPCILSPISIQSNQPFLTPTTSPKPIQHFSVMLILSNLIFCPISPRPLPNASGSFPAPSRHYPTDIQLRQNPQSPTGLPQSSQPMLTSLDPYCSCKLVRHLWLALSCILSLW